MRRPLENRGYGDAPARQSIRHLIGVSADLKLSEKAVSVGFHRRTHLPLILASSLMEKPVTDYAPIANTSAGESHSKL